MRLDIQVRPRLMRVRVLLLTTARLCVAPPRQSLFIQPVPDKLKHVATQIDRRGEFVWEAQDLFVLLLAALVPVCCCSGDG